MKPLGRRWGRWAAAAAAAAANLLVARANFLGLVNDDSLHVTLARSLRHGSFSILGAPVTDPLPGFALLLALPVRLFEPHWGLLRLPMLACSVLAVLAAYKLARRCLPEAWAFAAALLVGVSPAFLDWTGLAVPDVPLLALTTGLLAYLPERCTPRQTALLALGAAAGSLLRPEGAFFALSLALTVAARQGPRRGLLFALASFAPLAAWLARCRLLSGSPTGYVDNWTLQVGHLGDPAAQARHVVHLLDVLAGSGWLGMDLLPPPLRLTVSAAASALAFLGAWRLVRGEKAWAFAACAYATALAALHLTWQPVAPHYVLPLLPMAWIFILAELRERLAKPPGAAPAAAVLLGLLPALTAFQWGRRAIAEPTSFEPATMAWIRARTAPEALFQSFSRLTLTLLTGRPAQNPGLANCRDAWLAQLLEARVDYVHIEGFLPGGFFTRAVGFVKDHQLAWARSTPYAAEVYANAPERAVIFSIRHPDPARYMKAWTLYLEASRSAQRGEPAPLVRAKLRQALRLEPRLAYAWAELSEAEQTPAARRRDLEEAARADPTSEAIRQELDGLDKPARGPAPPAKMLY